MLKTLKIFKYRISIADQAKLACKIEETDNACFADSRKNGEKASIRGIVIKLHCR